jgi:methyl-accepting chemotaxis protein
VIGLHPAAAAFGSAVFLTFGLHASPPLHQATSETLAPASAVAEAPDADTSPDVLKPETAARASLQSTGNFVAPTLREITTDAGSRFGTALPVPKHEPASAGWLPQLPTIALGITIAAMAMSIVMAWRQSSMRDSHGQTIRTMTVGTRLTTAFGLLITLMLAMSAINARGQANVSDAKARLESCDNQSALLDHLHESGAAMESALHKFLVSGEALHVKQFSDAAATALATLPHFESAVETADQKARVAEFAAGVADLERTGVDLVATVLKRDATAEALRTAEQRIQSLLGELDATAVAQGATEESHAASELERTLAEAGYALTRYLASGQASDLDESKRLTAEAISDRAALEAHVHDPTRTLWLKEATEGLDWWSTTAEALGELGQHRHELVEVSLDRAMQTIADSDARLLASIEETRDRTDREIASTLMAGVTTSGIGTAFGLLVALASGVLVIRSLVAPIRIVTERAVAVAAGDLTGDMLTVRSSGEPALLLHSVNQMSAALRTSMASVHQASVEIDAGSKQIADTSSTLASGASQQAASIQEISASLQELTSRTERNAKDAMTAADAADGARKSATRGNEEMTQLTSAMAEIQSSSREISKIIKVIDEIAFQTNLLALNAAVEAARAGEAGKGFAVVAEEVRNLSGRSAEAARSTADLIESSVGRATRGAEVAERAAAALTDIRKGAEEVGSLLERIAAASSEQASAISQISTGVGELNSAVQSTAASSEELASAAEETSSQAGCLRENVSQFRI